MITVIRMEPDADERARRDLLASLRRHGQFVRQLTDDVLTFPGADEDVADAVDELDGIASRSVISLDNPLTDRGVRGSGTTVRVGDAAIGAGVFTVMAGPCSIESREQLQQTAQDVRTAGAQVLRGGLFKPRTSPYGFQGLGAAGTEISDEVRRETGLPLVSEIVDVRDLELMLEHVDMLQVGARNMQNFALLRELGRSGRPVLLKRGPAATVDEFLLAAEYLVSGGNDQVVLCERGIRTFERSYRFTLDITAVPVLQERTHLPVIVDPSHAAGASRWVPSLAMAAAAVGADGIIVESHCEPAAALCDAAQAVPSSELPDLVRRLRVAASAAGRTVPPPLRAVPAATARLAG